MRIGLITLGDPRKNGTWSGTPYRIFTELSKRHEVDWLDPGGMDAMAIDLYYKAMGRLTGRPVRSYSTRRFASALGRNLRRYELDKYDLLLSIGSSEIAHLETTVPIVHLTDATYAQMVGYYDRFDMGEKRNHDADEIQRRAFEASTQLIFASSWAARSAMNDYGVLEEKINVLHFGANQETPAKLAERSRGEKLRLLFVGKEYGRKGGDIAKDAVNALRAKGVDASLTMVGCCVASNVQANPGLRALPFIETISTFFREADIFILPTRAECAGIVFCEASAYGLPSFTTDTGGVPDYVEDGVNGRLLPPDATGEDFADAIAEVWSDQGALEEMRLSARRRYEEDLNWDVWMQRFESIAQKALTASKG